MQVKVQYLGILREFAGRESESVEVPEGAPLGELYATLQQRIPQLAEFRHAVAMAVNYEYSGPDRILARWRRGRADSSGERRRAGL